MYVWTDLRCFRILGSSRIGVTHRIHQAIYIAIRSADGGSAGGHGRGGGAM